MLAVVGHERGVRRIELRAAALAAGSGINGTDFVEAQERNDVLRVEVRVRAVRAVYLRPGVENAWRRSYPSRLDASIGS